MLNKYTETFLECTADAQEAKIVLFGAPFDGTTSYRPGTRFGSGAIRRESYGIESYSPYQDGDLLDGRVLDCGDLELPIGNAEKALAAIQAMEEEILSAGKLPFLLGGEHLVEEFRWGKDHVETRKFDFEGLEETLDRLKGQPVYFTLDLDVLDPSVFPGTGTPEPGGVSFEELRKAAELVCRKADVAACDVNELSPPYDPSGISTAAACKIVREMLIALQKKGE